MLLGWWVLRNFKWESLPVTLVCHIDNAATQAFRLAINKYQITTMQVKLIIVIGQCHVASGKMDFDNRLAWSRFGVRFGMTLGISSAS